MKKYGIGMYSLPFGIFKDIWCILWTSGMYTSWKFGIHFPVLVSCTKKNLATMDQCDRKLSERNRRKGSKVIHSIPCQTISKMYNKVRCMYVV
jgi:hypothetical protein